MKITVESTYKTIELVKGKTTVTARLWQGYTEGGVPCHVYITHIANDLPHGDPLEGVFQEEMREPHADANSLVRSLPAMLDI